MKRILLIVALALLPAIANAQTPEFKKFYKKYDSKKNFTTIMMSGDMFSSISGQSQNNSEVISNIFIITSEDASPAFDNDIAELVQHPEYDLKTSINDGDDRVRIYVRQSKDKIVEILMTVQDDDEAVVMCMTGQNLNINSVKQIAEQVDDLD